MNLIGSMRGDQLGRWIIVAVHVAIFAAVPVYTVVGIGGDKPWGPAALVLPAGFALLVLQLRHSLAAARGERPRFWQLTLPAQLLLAWVPLHWWSWQWAYMQLYVLPSFAMLLPLRIAIPATLAVVAGLDVATAIWYNPAAPVGIRVFQVAYDTIAAFLSWITLYGSTRLVRLVDELRAARAELAELTIGRERLRVSRDLHDLLGQSLSAVSLKGDLAIRLLGSDPGAARAEIESLTGVARDALRGARAVTRDEHTLSLRTEADGAAALLRAAGIRHEIDVELPELVPPVERVLAWTVREGVANVLRHSQAASCSIVGGHDGRRVFLEVVNDGVGAQPAASAGEQGSGLAGVAERARALAGSVSAGPAGEGRFRLRVELPEAAP